jgi:site-specific DNA-methyltransferase (adenine-specific)
MNNPTIIGKATLHNMDCMELLKATPDKFYDLAIVDPPYGLGDRLTDGGHKKNPMEKYRKSYEQKRWDVAPTQEYFNELARVSKNQIIWGGNYFDLPPTRGIIAWDKRQMMPTFSRWEMAWSSFDKPSKMFEMLSGDKDRTHPTQKPIKLYEWLLTNYAKQGDKILDTHGGSMSSVIACLNLGFEITCSELDSDYFKAGVKRVEQSQKQIRMFA